MIALVFALTVPPVWLYSRRLARPIRSFAAASDRIGRGNFEKLPVKGPNEIRVAALAMNDMQDRLERFVRERTAMAGAIAHDLRTPMARLAFLLNRLPEEQRRPLEHELSNMDRMISVTLDFVDSEAAIPTRDAIDLTLLVEGLIDDFADRGLDTSLSLPQTSAPIVVTGDQVLLTRMFNNLITNALTYGQCARASIWTENDQVIVEVTDKGPGMEATDIERAFEPFYRAERSRSTATGGVGLGLSIVQAVARSHQGTVSLRNAPAGGLIARVTLPLSERDAAQSEQRVTPSLRA
jgi:signal transduction histidine kinase